MAEPRNDPEYFSTNHRKYTSGSRLYDWHLHAFKETLYGLVAQSGGKAVLDAGCGEGFVVDYLAGKDPSLRLTGVDLSSEAVAYATEHFGDKARFRTGSVYKLPFSDRSFDLVICSEVLEHLDDPAGALKELRRVSRNAILITVPLEPYFQWLNNVGQWLGLSVDPEHVNFWTKKTFQSFVRAHFDDPVFAWKHIYQLALVKV